LDTQANKKKEIAEQKEEIEMHKAYIEKLTVEIEEMDARVKELEEDIGRWNKDIASATAVREKEATDYDATLKDYMESIEALKKAIAVLKAQDFDRAQAEALLQVHRQRLVPLSAKRALMSFLQEHQPNVVATDEQMPDDQLFIKAPEAAGYSFQSGGIIDMLKKLLDEFSQKKLELEEGELAARHAYQQILQMLHDMIENAEHEISFKKKLIAEALEKKSEHELARDTIMADTAEDEKYLADTVALCDQKKIDYESRNKLRAGEIDAIEKAIEIIESSSVSGAADKHLPTLVQQGQADGAALAQLRSDSRSPSQKRAADFLAARAQASGSRMLSMISQRVAEDPFKKVKKMIKDLIVKLMEEATAETEHKGWCDTELTTNKQTRDDKTEEVAKLSSEIEDLTAAIAQLAQEIADLTAAVKELDEAMAKATADRMASKEKNQQTIKDAKEAQVAVEQATAILKDYYAKAGEATALSQAPADDAPETWDSPYKGAQDKASSIIDFLEVILSDFARLESETTTAEAMEQEEYDTFMFESKKDKALKENAIGHKTESKTEKESTLATTKEELKTTQEQLDAAMAYYEKLKPTCVDSGITYEDRVKRREEEIQSLQEALKILQGEDMPESIY